MQASLSNRKTLLSLSLSLFGLRRLLRNCAFLAVHRTLGMLFSLPSRLYSSLILVVGGDLFVVAPMVVFFRWWCRERMKVVVMTAAVRKHSSKGGFVCLIYMGRYDSPLETPLHLRTHFSRQYSFCLARKFTS